MRIEKFTARKFVGVIASLIGIILISRVDLSTPDSGDVTPTLDGGGEGAFPHKSPAEIALGDAMAAFSAIMYGVYTIVMKKQVGNESRVNMQLFFGLVGFFNLVLLWPGFFVLHWTGVEPFELPSTNRVWMIILVWNLLHLTSRVVLLERPLADSLRSTLSHPSSPISPGPTPCS